MTKAKVNAKKPDAIKCDVIYAWDNSLYHSCNNDIRLISPIIAEIELYDWYNDKKVDKFIKRCRKLGIRTILRNTINYNIILLSFSKSQFKLFESMYATKKYNSIYNVFIRSMNDWYCTDRPISFTNHINTLSFQIGSIRQLEFKSSNSNIITISYCIPPSDHYSLYDVSLLQILPICIATDSPSVIELFTTLGINIKSITYLNYSIINISIYDLLVIYSYSALKNIALFDDFYSVFKNIINKYQNLMEEW